MNNEVWNIGPMTHARTPPLRHQVNWDDPELKSLLEKTDGWGLENRGVFAPIECELHVGWGAGAVKSAMLVFKSNGVLVVEADFIIPPSENVRIDYVEAGVSRSQWGTVVEGRPGRRTEDKANGIHVYWVHSR